MSWVEKTAGGRHRAAYRDGTGRRHSRIFVRKADAKTWLAAADADRARGLWVDPRGGALPFRDWAETWFATRTVRPTTSAGDHGRYNNHLQPAFGDLPLKDLTPMRIRTFVSELSGRRAPGARHGAARARAAVHDAARRGRGGSVADEPVPQDGAPRRRRATTRSTCRPRSCRRCWTRSTRSTAAWC